MFLVFAFKFWLRQITQPLFISLSKKTYFCHFIVSVWGLCTFTIKRRDHVKSMRLRERHATSWSTAGGQLELTKSENDIIRSKLYKLNNIINILELTFGAIWNYKTRMSELVFWSWKHSLCMQEHTNKQKHKQWVIPKYL